MTNVESLLIKDMIFASCPEHGNEEVFLLLCGQWGILQSPNHELDDCVSYLRMLFVPNSLDNPKFQAARAKLAEFSISA